MPSDLGGFMTGFEQGYGFMQKMANKHRAYGLAQKKIEGQQAYDQKRLALGERAQQLNEEKFKQHQQAAKRAERQQGVHSMLLDLLYQNTLNGGLVKNKPAMAAITQKHNMLPMSYMAGPEFGSGLQTMNDVAAGKIHWKNPAVAQAFNAVYPNRIKQGVGEMTPDGRRVTDKRINGFYPTPSGSGVFTDIATDTQGRDGSIQTHNAAHTEGRHAGDWPPAETSIDELIHGLAGAHGARMLAQAYESGDQAAFTRILHGMAAANGINPNEFAPQPQKHDYHVVKLPKGGLGVFDSAMNQWSRPPGKYGMAPQQPSAPAGYYAGGKHSPSAIYSQISSGIFRGAGGYTNPVTGEMNLPGGRSEYMALAKLNAAAEEAWRKDKHKRSPAWYINRALETYKRHPDDFEDHLETAFSPQSGATAKPKTQQSSTAAKSPHGAQWPPSNRVFTAARAALKRSDAETVIDKLIAAGYTRKQARAILYEKKFNGG